MRMGPVHLAVASLVRSVDYWRHAVGLRVHGGDGDVVRLGAGGEDLVVLHEQPGAGSARGSSGLFHVALLVPAREDLGRFLVHAVQERVALEGLSDHRVSEAIYLRDPDGHGIEVYADRPRARWEGRVREWMTTLPLNTQQLVGTIEQPSDFDGLPPGTVVGHVHLCVADVPATEAFYVRTFGLETMATLGERATFLGWDGYHHHVGANTWESAGAAYAAEGTARLLEMTVVGDREERLTDPSGIPVRVVRSVPT